MTEKVLTLEDVAKLLEVSERTVMRQVKAGKLKAFRAGNALRFKIEAVEEYMTNQEVKPESYKPETPPKRKKNAA